MVCMESLARFGPGASTARLMRLDDVRRPCVDYSGVRVGTAFSVSCRRAIHDTTPSPLNFAAAEKD